MTDRDYAIKSMKEITFQMATHAQDYGSKHGQAL